MAVLVVFHFVTVLLLWTFSKDSVMSHNLEDDPGFCSPSAHPTEKLLSNEKINEHAKFLLKNAIEHSNLKPKLSASLLCGYFQMKLETLVFWDPVFGTWFRPLERFVSSIRREQIHSQHACSFFLLFGVGLKVAYSKLIFGQRRAFRNKKEELEGLWGSTHPELFVFIERAQNVRLTKLC